MFGGGLHFRLQDLLAVKSIAIPGAIGQILVSTILGGAIGLALGWPMPKSLLLGVAASVASTVVLVRVLSVNNKLETPEGHIAVGWLIVEDIFTVFVLVMLPAIASAGADPDAGSSLLAALAIALAKLTVLTAIVLMIGAKVIPWLLKKVAQTRSRELFTLTILSLAIAIASGSAIVFGASFALGAFLAGMVVGQSKAGHQAAADALPMRDAFAVLFFVSVGMLLIRVLC
jgi:CPA2 family monovalent cation:H+ antiporter-2